MATLMEIAYYSRKIIKYGLIAFLVLILLLLTYDIIKNIYLKLYPPAPTPPTVKFGKLPSLQFPQENLASITQYQLETPSGNLPTLPTQTKVYLSPQPTGSLLALDKAKEEALKLGFKDSPQMVSETIYRWTETTPPNRILEMDILNRTFTLSFTWQNDPEVINNLGTLSKEKAIVEAKSFLERLEISAQDLKDARIESTYLKISTDQLVPAISLSEANFVKVDIFRHNLDDYPVLTSDPQKGIVSLLIAGVNNSNKRIVKVEFNYFPVDEETFATYPLKSNSQAWEELKNNEASIINFEGKDEVIIRRIYLAYYDSPSSQSYLQPIFVFEGDNSFLAYLPAITAEWRE